MYRRRRFFLLAALLLFGAAGLRLWLHDPAARNYRNGQHAEHAGDFAAAENEYTLATRANPKMPDAWTALGRVQKRFGRLAAAQDSYRRALDLAPGNRSEALLGIGWILLQRSELDGVEQLSKEALALGEEGVAHQLAARRLAVLFRAKLVELEDAVLQAGGGREHAFQYGSLAEFRAYLKTRAQDEPARPEVQALLSQAEELCRQAIGEAAQGGPSGRLLQADLLLNAGRPAEAETIAVQLAKWPKPSIASAAMVALARIAKDRDDPAAAIRLVGDALSADPANVTARLELRRIRLYMADFESMMLEIDPAADSSAPALVPVDYTAGSLSLLKADYHDAVARLAVVVNQHPQWLQARIMLAIAYYRAGKNEHALEQFRIVTEAAPDLMPAQVALARIFLVGGNLRETIARCRQILRAEPSNPVALEMLAEAYFRNGQVFEANEIFQRRVDIYLGVRARQDASAADSLAVLLERYPQSDDNRAQGIINANNRGLIHLAAYLLHRDSGTDAEAYYNAAETCFDLMRDLALGTGTAGPGESSLTQAWPLAEYQLAMLRVRSGDSERMNSARRILSDSLQNALSVAEKDAAGKVSRPGGGQQTLPQLIRDELQLRPVVSDMHTLLAQIALQEKDHAAVLEQAGQALQYKYDLADELEAHRLLMDTRRALAGISAEPVAGYTDALMAALRELPGDERYDALMQCVAALVPARISTTRTALEDLGRIFECWSEFEKQCGEAAKSAQAVFRVQRSNSEFNGRLAGVYELWQAQPAQKQSLCERLIHMIEPLGPPLEQEIEALKKEMLQTDTAEKQMKRSALDKLVTKASRVSGAVSDLRARQSEAGNAAARYATQADVHLQRQKEFSEQETGDQGP